MRISPSKCIQLRYLDHILIRRRAWIHGITGKLKNKPLLDMVGGVIEDYEFLWDQYYFPTATM